MMKQYCIYIMASQSGVLYIGVTGNLSERVLQHKKKEVPGFTSKYNVDRLVYFEAYDQPANAILREKQMKSWPRARKVALINQENPEWSDLSREWYGS